MTRVRKDGEDFPLPRWGYVLGKVVARSRHQLNLDDGYESRADALKAIKRVVNWGAAHGAHKARIKVRPSGVSRSKRAPNFRTIAAVHRNKELGPEKSAELRRALGSGRGRAPHVDVMVLYDLGTSPLPRSRR